MASYLNFQYIQALTLYSVKMPVLQILILSKIRELVNFEMIKPIPLYILKILLGEDQYSEIFNKNDKNLDANLERSGVKTASFMANLQTFIIIFVYIVIFLILSSPFLLWKKTRDIMVSKLKGFKKSFIWNGVI